MRLNGYVASLSGDRLIPLFGARFLAQRQRLPQSLAQLHGCGAAKVEGVAVGSGTESNTSMQAWIAFVLLPITPRFRTWT